MVSVNRVSVNRGGPQLINELINEIYQSGLILKLDADSIVNNEVDIIENFNAIGFYPHCTRNVPAN